MFSIVFERLTETGDVKLKLNHFDMSPELYDQFENTYNIELINERLKRTTVALFQNRPNPLQSYTTIGFNLPEASDIELNIYNIDGELVKQISGNYPKGTNNIQVDWNKAKIIYYYSLKAGNHTATKKMIVVD
jgi:hypothetical protein